MRASCVFWRHAPTLTAKPLAKASNISASAISRRPTNCHGVVARPMQAVFSETRSEERRVGKELYVRVDLGGRRIIKKKNRRHNQAEIYNNKYNNNKVIVIL